MTEYKITIEITGQADDNEGRQILDALGNGVSNYNRLTFEDLIKIIPSFMHRTYIVDSYNIDLHRMYKLKKDALVVKIST